MLSVILFYILAAFCGIVALALGAIRFGLPKDGAVRMLAHRYYEASQSGGVKLTKKQSEDMAKRSYGKMMFRCIFWGSISALSFAIAHGAFGSLV